MRIHPAAIPLCLTLSAAFGADIDESLVRTYFAEAAALAQRDAGRLWGVDFAGPMLFVDPSTRQVAANRADAEGLLKERAGVYVGELPESVGIANFAVEWAGVRWTMIMWPLPDAPYARARLMMHESFHRVQPELNLPALSPANSHLDTMRGRLYLRLEWRALDAALLAEGDARRAAARDALLFRAARLHAFPGALDEERALNLNEGLAEYTGWRLCGLEADAAASRIALTLEQNEWGGPFARSFAYTSGPAYGYLLDDLAPGWRDGLTHATDLPDLLAPAVGWSAPGDPAQAAQARLDAYDGMALRLAEERREQERERRLAAWRERFFEGPVLVLPLGPNVQYSYDPRGVEGFDEQSSVYRAINVSDDWGVLTVSDGALLVRKDGRVAEVRVPAPAAPDAIEGDGWTIELAAGWRLAPGARVQDRTLAREP